MIVGRDREIGELKVEKFVIKLKIIMGVPVKMKGKEFILQNEKLFDRNKNKEQQIEFLKKNDCYDSEGTFVLSAGGVGIVNENWQR